jgi:hypothetical protein
MEFLGRHSLSSKRASILLFPKAADQVADRKKLPKFKPHDLRALFVEARAADETGLVQALRRRNQDQMTNLLRALGIDPSSPDSYKRGFFLLAHYWHGVGQVAWYPRRTNRNAARWAPEHDWALLMEVARLMGKSLSELAACKRIASDPKLKNYLPYREQTHRSGSDFSRANEAKRRQNAIWRRLQYLKKRSASTDPILAQLIGTVPSPESGPAHWLYLLDFPKIPKPSGVKSPVPPVVMKNKAPSQ